MLSIRRYQPADHARVLELHEEALRETGAYIEGALEPDLDHIEAVYLDEGEFVVGELSERIVAMGAIRPAHGYVRSYLPELPERTAEIKRMRVDPAHQRRGFGQRIYDILEAWAREQDFTDLVLDTTPVQTAAMAFYEDNGFDRCAEETIPLGDQSFELYFYRKPVP